VGLCTLCRSPLRSMPSDRWLPPMEERFLGLEFYATTGRGLGGRLKQEPEDFRVEELSAYPRPAADGPVTVLRIRSRGWEQHELTAQLAHQMGIPMHRIRWAGTKDRRAVADRLLTYRGDPPRSDQISLPNVEVLEIYRTREQLVLGHHYGNRFQVHMTEVPLPPEEALDRAKEALGQLQTLGGFPNFFGIQRFGEVRPITHSVGRALVHGDVAKAVDIYLTEIPPGETPLAADARRAYALHRDAQRALREFPVGFQFERTLLDHLARGHTPDRALRALGRPLRTLFIHAYQAYLFNRYLSRRRSAGLSLVEPVAGDWLLRVTRDGTVPGRDPVPVSDDNLVECQLLTDRHRARLAGPLVGYSTPPIDGPPGVALEAILRDEGVTREQFRLPATPDIASEGNWRPLWCPAPAVELDSGRNSSGTSIRLAFHLPRGTYATVLLREFMKTGATAVGET
jgi:tRNA pseudouridine13 synthase